LRTPEKLSGRATLGAEPSFGLLKNERRRVREALEADEDLPCCGDVGASGEGLAEENAQCTGVKGGRTRTGTGYAFFGSGSPFFQCLSLDFRHGIFSPAPHSHFQE